MWAAEKGDGIIVRELMEHNGSTATNLNLLSVSGQKAVDIALAAGHKDVAALLDHGFCTQPAAGVDKSQSLPIDTLVNFTELETALLGLDLAALIPVFHQHQMSYDTLLLLDDRDLDMMNISEVIYSFIGNIDRYFGDFASLPNSMTIRLDTGRNY